jgi:hypothetical protein
MPNENYVSRKEFSSRKEFEADCKKRDFNIQEEGEGLILAFAGKEYMGSFNGTEGFLLEEQMVKPIDTMKRMN